MEGVQVWAWDINFINFDCLAVVLGPVFSLSWPLGFLNMVSKSVLS